MRIDLLFLQLAVVFLPGLIWTQIVATYGMKERPGTAEFLVRAFIFGFLAYVPVYLGYRFFDVEFSFLALQIGDSAAPVGDQQHFLYRDFMDEIAWSSIMAVVFSFVWIRGSANRWLIRMLNRARIGTHGTDDIWSYTFSQQRPEVDYVRVRDLERSIIYEGWVHAYSETRKPRELLLRNAIVRDETNEPVDVPLLYMARAESDIIIEFPLREKPRESPDTGVKAREVEAQEEGAP